VEGKGEVTKTNAMRLLETAHLDYGTRSYEVDLTDLSAETVAKKVGLPCEAVYKTLLCQSNKRVPCFAVIPAGRELCLSTLARALAARSVTLVPEKELRNLTGYVRGGVTVLGAKKSFAVFVDRLCLSLDTMSVSAGVRGTQILLRPIDYIKVTSATPVTDLSRPVSSPA